MGLNAAMIVDVENVTGSRLPAVETRRKIKDKSGVANWLDKISLSGFANFSSQPTFPVLKLSLTERSSRHAIEHANLAIRSRSR